MTKAKNLYSKSLGLFIIALFLAAFHSMPAFADVLECTPQQNSGNTVPDCPNGQKSRNDINVACVANQSNNNCIDIMPAQNKSQVVRIPEDVCFRNEGWSRKRNHNGMDYALPQGAGVVAAADGKVRAAGATCSGTGTGGNGIYVKIEHNMTSQSSDEGAIVQSGHTACFYTLYLHLSKVHVNVGDTVKKGDKIGEVGGTGCRGGRLDVVYPVHLHFEMRTCGNAVINPMCPGLGDLCPNNKKTDEEGNTVSAFNPDECRDCVKNAAQCNAGFIGGDMGYGGGSEDFHEVVASDKSCTIADYKGSITSCMFCEIFKILFNTASQVAAISFKVLSPAVSSVVIIATAIWLAFTILKYISSFEVKEPRTMIKEILSQLLLVLFVLVILMVGPAKFFHYTMEPIFNTGMKLAIMTSTNSNIAQCSDFEVITMERGGGLPESMGMNILCVIKTIQDSFLDILALGSVAMCIGFFEKSWKHIPIFPHFGYVFTGLGLWVAAILILIIYPWLLIDSVLKLSVAVSLLPAAIGCFAFKSTKKYASKVWETFMNSMFTFMFLSIILFILIKMIDNTILEADLMYLMDDSTDHGEILKKIGWWTTTFLQVCFAILLGWAVLGEGSEFASEFSDGMGFKGNIGSSVGTLAMSGVKGAGVPALKGAASVGKKAGTAVGRSVSEKVNTAKINRQAKLIQNSKHTKVDENGNLTQSYKSWTGKNVTRTLNVDANGNKSITKTQTDGKGNTTTTTKDKFASVAVTKDKNGNVVREDYKMQAAGAKYMLNKDGTINQVAVNAMMQNSLHDKETVQKAIMTQMINERFGAEKGLSKNFASRDMKMSVDENGNNVFEIVQQTKNGTIQRAKMVMGEKRALIEVEEIDKKGKSSKTLASDGVFKKETNKSFDKNGKEVSSTSHYDVMDKYKSSIPIDSNGVLSKSIQNAGTMFTQKDLDAMQDSFKKYRKLSNVDGIIR